MTIEYIRKSYGVPAKRGGRVVYTGRGGELSGTITGTRAGRLLIRLNGDANSFPYHPTWELRYLNANGGSDAR